MTIKKFQQFLKEEKDDYLYHASYGVHKKNIAKHGLTTNSGHKNWSDSNPNKVYLAKNSDVAHSYAETSDDVPEHYLRHIVVYKVHKKHLDSSKITKDTNVKNNDNDTVEYGKSIPSKHLHIHKEFKD